MGKMNEFKCHHCGELFQRARERAIYCGKACMDQRAGRAFWLGSKLGSYAKRPGFEQILDELEELVEKSAPCECGYC